MKCNRPETTARCFSTFRSHRAIVEQVNNWWFTQANQSDVTDVPVVANPYPPVFTVTGEQAHIDFQTPAYPWRTPKHFLAALGLWCHPSDAIGQSQQRNVKPFYPIICIRRWDDASDSLARWGQDWPDGLPINPAPPQCYIDPQIRSDRHTEPKQGGSESGAVRAAAALFTDSEVWLYASNLNALVGFIAQYCFSTTHQPLCHAPEFWDIIREGLVDGKAEVRFRLIWDQSLKNAGVTEEAN